MYVYAWEDGGRGARTRRRIPNRIEIGHPSDAVSESRSSLDYSLCLRLTLASRSYSDLLIIKSVYSQRHMNITSRSVVHLCVQCSLNVWNVPWNHRQVSRKWDTPIWKSQASFPFGYKITVNAVIKYETCCTTVLVLGVSLSRSIYSAA